MKRDGIESERLLSLIPFSAHALAARESTGGLGVSSLLIPHPRPRWCREVAETLGPDLKSGVQSPSTCTSPLVRLSRMHVLLLRRQPELGKPVALRGTLPRQSKLSLG